MSDRLRSVGDPFEEMLRTALDEEAASISPDPRALENIRERIAARRRRLVLLAPLATAAAAAAVVAGVAAGGALLHPESRTPGTTAGTPTQVPATPGTTVPSPTPEAHGPRFAAAGPHGIGVYDAVTGRLVRMVSTTPGGAVDTDPVADATTGQIYFLRYHPGSCGAQLLAAPVRGGQPRVVVSVPADATGPAVSADGRELAYLETPCGGGSASLVLVDSAAPAHSSRVTGLGSVSDRPSFSPDGKHLAFTAGMLGASSDDRQVRVLDLTAHRWTPVACPDDTPGCVTFDGRYDESGRLTFVAWQPAQHRLRLVRESGTPATGERLDVLVDTGATEGSAGSAGSPGSPGSPGSRGSVTIASGEITLDVDPTGENLLWTVRAADGTTSTYRLALGTVTPVPGSETAPAWLPAE